MGVFNILSDLLIGGFYFFLTILLVLTLRRLIRILIRNSVAKSKALFYLPILEFIIFSIILVTTSYALINEDKVIGLIIVLVILFSMWKFLKNYISGIVFRLTNRDITGSMVNVDDSEGRVSAYLMTSIALKNEKNEVIKIPYTLFYNKYTTSSISKENVVKYTFGFAVESLPKGIESKVKNHLLSSPFVIWSKPIYVNYGKVSKELNVSFHSLSSQYETQLKKEIEELL